jgi:hypothetical protein
MLMLRRLKLFMITPKQIFQIWKRVKSGGVTKQQLDQARLALTNAGSNLKQANINVGDT